MSEASKTYDHDHLVNHWYDKAPDASWICQIAEATRLHPRLCVLDIGCGGGRYALELHKYGIQKVLGIDFSMEMAKMARGNDVTGVVSWGCGDASALPFKSHSFDLTLMRYLIHHVEDKARVIAEAFRVLRHQGLLALETASHDQLRKHYDHIIFPRLMEIDLLLYPSLDELDEMIKEARGESVRHYVISRKKGEYRPIVEVLDMSHRMAEEKRGPISWRLLTDEERLALHEARIRRLPELFPDGLVPREWFGTLIVATKP